MKKPLLYLGLILCTVSVLSFKPNFINPSPTYHEVVDIPNSTNPPLGKTGAPGEGSCVDCHSGSTLPASGVVTFSFSGTNNLYIPGQTYDITIGKSGSSKTGFQMTALDGSDVAAGVFTAGTNSSTGSTGGRNYIRQSASTGVDTWTFQWNAPTISAGDVTFYYALNEADGLAGSNGDQIYLGSNTVSEDISSSVEDNEFAVDMKLLNESLVTSLYLEEETNIYFSAQDMNGKQLDYHNFGIMNAGVHSLSIPLDTKYSSSIYLFTIFVDNRPYTTKISLP